MTPALFPVGMMLAALLSLWLQPHPLWLSPVLGLLFFWKRLPGWLWVLPLCLLLCSWRLYKGPSHIEHLVPEQGGVVELQLRISGDPSRMDYPGRDPEWRMPVQVMRIYRGESSFRCTGRLQLRSRMELPPSWVTGRHVHLQGALRFRPTAHSGLWKGVGVLDLDPGKAELLKSHEPLLPLYEFRRLLITRIQRGAGTEERAALLQALLLGAREDLPRAHTQRFARTGLIHLLALSGLHLMLIASILSKFLLFTPLGFRQRVAILIPMLWAFTLSSGFHASTLRALIMLACVRVAPMLYRKANPVHALGLAAGFILILSPVQILAVGYWYSILLVGSLLLAGRWMEVHAREWLQGDPWAPPENQWPWWKRRIARPLVMLSSVSLLCFVVSTPLTAYHFNLFSPIAILGNVLAVPLAFLVLLCAFPILPLLLIFPPAASSFLLAPAAWSAEALLRCAAVLEQVPYGIHWVRRPGLWVLLLFYALCILVWQRPRLLRVSMALMLMLAGYCAMESFLKHQRSEAYLLDAGRGQAAWFRNGQSSVLMVDAGDAFSGWKTRRSLQQGGIDRIEALIFTHADPHHVEGLESFLESHVPEQVFVAGPDVGHNLFAGLEAQPLWQGDVLELAGWRVEVLWPPRDVRSRSAGNRGLVLRILDQEAAVLLQGGADERVEQELLMSGQLPRARWWMAPALSRQPAGDPAYLRALAPEAVFFSGEGFQGPSPGRLQSEARVLEMELPLWRVEPEGHLQLELKRGWVKAPLH